MDIEQRKFSIFLVPGFRKFNSLDEIRKQILEFDIAQKEMPAELPNIKAGIESPLESLEYFVSHFEKTDAHFGANLLGPYYLVREVLHFIRSCSEPANLFKKTRSQGAFLSLVKTRNPKTVSALDQMQDLGVIFERDKGLMLYIVGNFKDVLSLFNLGSSQHGAEKTDLRMIKLDELFSFFRLQVDS